MVSKRGLGIQLRYNCFDTVASIQFLYLVLGEVFKFPNHDSTLSVATWTSSRSAPQCCSDLRIEWLKSSFQTLHDAKICVLLGLTVFSWRFSKVAVNFEIF